jgi:hypothetical protein
VPHTKKRDDSLVKPPFLGDIKNERGNILRSPSIDPSRLPKKRFLSISFGDLSSRRKEVGILGGARSRAKAISSEVPRQIYEIENPKASTIFRLAH